MDRGNGQNHGLGTKCGSDGEINTKISWDRHAQYLRYFSRHTGELGHAEQIVNLVPSERRLCTKGR
eukprot:145441-Pleurochrysis_carterae.AAC.3